MYSKKQVTGQFKIDEIIPSFILLAGIAFTMLSGTIKQSKLLFYIDFEIL